MRTLAAALAAMLKAKKATPKYCEMRCKAISALKEHRELSKQTILKYVMENFNVGKIAGAIPLMLALECGAMKASVKQSKGKGAIGSFSVAEKAAKTAKAMEPTKETRPAAKTTKPTKTARPAKTTKCAKARRSAGSAV